MINRKKVSENSWGSGCSSWILADLETLSVKQESMPPGTAETLHKHLSKSQFFFILKGIAKFTVENSISILQAQEGILVRENQFHTIANHAETPLEFLVVSTSNNPDDRIEL